MSDKFNLSLGNAQNAEQISEKDLKSGIRKEDFKDSIQQSIFDALDDGNQILEEKEINKLRNAITQAAAEDGDATNLSNKEAKSLLKILGLTNIKIDDLFGFLKIAKVASSNIDYTTRNIEAPDEIRITYKPDENGIVKTTIYGNDGTQIRTEQTDEEKVRTQNPDGGYTDHYKDGSIINCDKDGRETSGKLANGITWSNKYNDDGSYTSTYSDGDVINYDKDGKGTSGKLANGITWSNKYNDDGSRTKTYSDGEVANYDKDGKRTSGKLGDGTKYESKYRNDGKLGYTEYTRKDGSKYYWGGDDNPKAFACKTANGNIKASPMQGETFNDTMIRLGITDPQEQQIFIKANPKAYQRGYFLLTDPKKENYDVYIPKSIADKLDMNKVLCDGTTEYNKHQDAKKKKQTNFGI